MPSPCECQNHTEAMRRLAIVFWLGVLVFVIGVVVLLLDRLAGSALMAIGSVTFTLALLRGEDLENQCE